MAMVHSCCTITPSRSLNGATQAVDFERTRSAVPSVSASWYPSVLPWMPPVQCCTDCVASYVSQQPGVYVAALCTPPHSLCPQHEANNEHWSD